MEDQPIHNEAVHSGPAEEYAARLAARRASREALTTLDLRLSRLRLATFAIAVVLLIAAWQALVSPLWLFVPALTFAYAAVRHDRVIRASRAADRAIAFYERGVARLEDRWAGDGEAGERFADESHLYARDLDLFGRGSLFQLLSVARTGAGERILADWLKAPAGRDEIQQRHESVRELRPSLDLREQIAIAGADVRTVVDPDTLLAWAEAPVVLTRPILRVLAVMTTIAVITLAVLWLSEVVPFGVLLLGLAVQGVASAVMRQRVEHVLHTSDEPTRELIVLRDVLIHLENARFAATRLSAVQAALETGPRAASHVIARLRTLIELHDWQHNMMFAPIAAILMWDTHLAWAIEGWRRDNGGRVRAWLEAAGQFEAFSSLAAYHYEHPADPFPQIDDAAAASRSIFDGRDLGHPLLPARQMIRNDVGLTGDVQLLVVSGSNMSGKSTLLRTVGVNTVLALAGAPVRAASLRLTPVHLGATLRIQDSLQEGRSRFYAEITRIRELSEVARAGRPLLFLLDELFHGTNSHDRLVGASGVLTSLIDRGAIGLITTHDLALTAVSETLAPRALNVHFEDVFEGGEIHFDYRMKPGPVTRSNAVALMRAVGLDVPVQ
jgi:hypothetical protein